LAKPQENELSEERLTYTVQERKDIEWTDALDIVAAGVTQNGLLGCLADTHKSPIVHSLTNDGNYLKDTRFIPLRTTLESVLTDLSKVRVGTLFISLQVLFLLDDEGTATSRLPSFLHPFSNRRLRLCLLSRLVHKENRMHNQTQEQHAMGTKSAPEHEWLLFFGGLG
jgi:hypothetical protein